MTSKMLLDLTRLVQKCPRCKSEKLEGDSGSLEVSSDLIRRTCACGYSLSLIIEETDSNAQKSSLKVPEKLKDKTILLEENKSDIKEQVILINENKKEEIVDIDGQISFFDNN